jgi:K+-transporting ATPase ATPase C chain
MLTHLRPALVLLALFVALTGVAYPLAMTGVAQIALSKQANGSLIERNGTVVGSDIIGQPFTSDRYFQPRPSATSAPDPKDSTKTIDAPYNAAGSGGSNLGPTSQKLVDRVKAETGRLKIEAAGVPLPADAATTSASGLDPHISPAYALLQVARVAKARGLPEQPIRALVERESEGRMLGFVGEPRVNVLRLNLALDALKP